jgi:hypothetical protein
MFTLSDGGTRGVAAVGRNGQAEGSTSSLWFFPTQASQGTLAVDAPSVGPLIPGFDPDPEATTASGQAVLLAAAPLGVGGPSSLVAVSTVPDGGGQAEVIIASLTGTPLSFAAQNLTGSNVPPLLPNLPLIVDAGPEASAPLRTTVAEDGQLALTDVDGDGYADMILLTGGTVTCPASNASRSVVVFWNDHQGGFGPAQVLAQCYLTRCGAFGDAGSPTLTCPRAFATLAAAPTGAPTIAYVTGSSLGFTQFGAAASGQARPLLPAVGPADAGDAAPAPNPFAALPSGITGIASGDINGDGVPDLAILAHGTLYLFQGVPVNK